MTVRLCCQLLFCSFGVLAAVVTVLFVVFQNFDSEDDNRWVKSRFFPGENFHERRLEMALLIFITTFICQSKTVLWFHIKSFLMKNRLCNQLTLGIIHVAVSMICISLFDFRIIHVQGTSKLMRSSILFADLTSLFFTESMGENY